MDRAQRMRFADAAWLDLDRPENRLVVTAVLRLSGVLDLGELRDLVQERMVRPHPRFRQLPRRSAVRAQRPRWRFDPSFDLAQHVVDATPVEPCDDAGLQRLAGELVSRALDPDRPAWQIHLVRRVDGGSALVARFHHSLADGTALATVLLSLTGSAAPGTDPVPRPGPSRSPLRRAITGTRAAVAMLVTVTRLVLTLGEPPTNLRGSLGPDKKLALTRPHDLDDVRRVARAQGVSINDVLLAATAGGLRHHLLEQGSSVADLRVLVPVDLRGGRAVPADLGNLFGVVVLTLPVGQPDPVERLRAVTERTVRHKLAVEATGTFLLLRVVGALPRFARRLAVAVLEESVSVVVTNVPGPREALTLGACRVEDIAFWAPTVGRVGLGISLFSYAGTLTVGVAVDARLHLDAARLAAAIEDEIATVLGQAPPGA